MKKVFGALAFLSFFFLLGTAGAVEQGIISLGPGTVRMVVSLATFGLFCKLSGAFEPYVYEEKKSRPRCSRPKGGKRKSSNKVYHEMLKSKGVRS